METRQTQLSIFERFSLWIRESVMIKLLSIGFLVLILLIPASWVESIINERQYRADDVVREISEKWAGKQTLTGPVLVIPYKRYETIDRGKFGTETHEYTEKAYFLPEELSINGNVKPQVLHRGIFEAAVYESTLSFKSVFEKPDFKALNIREENVLWQDAVLAFGISDLQGMNENPVFKSGEKELSAEPSSDLNFSRKNTTSDNGNYAYNQAILPTSGIIARLDWNSVDNFEKSVSINLDLKGSSSLNFTPAGKTTTANLKGTWNNPSFDGKFLPQSREITEDGFDASWKVLHFNRPFPQQWKENTQDLSGSEFGVNLLIPVDQYQKSTRTSKYSILIILLTFIALFLLEIVRKIRIHPFQYILTGAALIIYYTLLLSLSEHIGFNPAYITASIATTVLIGLYSTSFLKNNQLSALLTALLSVFYAFIYVIILQQDFSLLFGSIGLFVIVGLLMFFSRKINWYRETNSDTAISNQ